MRYAFVLDMLDGSCLGLCRTATRLYSVKGRGHRESLRVWKLANGTASPLLSIGKAVEHECKVVRELADTVCFLCAYIHTTHVFELG